MNFRGKSKTKYSDFSRPSTYSNLPEGTSLTQLDILKPSTADYGRDTFVSALDQEPTNVTRKTPGVRFDDNVQERTMSGHDAVPKKKTKLSPLDLKSRLYDKPENSQAIKVIRHQEAAKRKELQDETERVKSPAATLGPVSK